MQTHGGFLTTLSPTTPRVATVSVTRALGSGTRALIYEHLCQVADGLTVRDVAAVFDLHPNVARTHLELLADAGLVTVGRRKHPAGGRPAKVYAADADASPSLDDQQPVPLPPSWAGLEADPGLVVRLLVALLDPAPSMPGQAHTGLAGRGFEVAAAEGRRLVAVPRERPGAPGLLDAAAAVVTALNASAPAVRVLRGGQEWVDIGGLQALTALVVARPELAEALQRGLLAGAFAALGAPVLLTKAEAPPAGGRAWRARPLRQIGPARSPVVPAASIDVRAAHREAGVVRALQAITGLRPGDVLEVLTEGPGAPAAFARWADRAGHQLLGVERAADDSGAHAIRLLLRKGT